MNKNGIKFRDRSLKCGEHSHYVCENCGAEINLDTANRHRCRK